MSREYLELLSQVMEIEFSKVSGDGWDAVFDRLLALLGADDPDIVDATLGRTAAAIWAEKYGPGSDANARPAASGRRLEAVLAKLAQRADVVEQVVGFAAHAGSMADDDEFRTTFLKWIDDFRPPPDAGPKRDELALIIQLRLGTFGGDRETASPYLTGLLDHASLQVRACAAEALGELIPEEDGESDTLAETLQLIHDREIERPGIAGPFYEGLGYDLKRLHDEGPASIKAWMLSIIENRKAPEPPLLEFHFNGIDFHAHEVFAADPEGVGDLMRIGRADIAVMAATDEDAVIEGMEQVLVELGNSNDETVCRLASWHLAYCYHTLHPRGEELGFVSRLPLSGGEELFLNGYPDNPRFPYAAILYPPIGRPFTSDDARAWIDCLLPADLRGAARPFYPGNWPGETAGGWQISGNKAHFAWACGATGRLKGDPKAGRWDSLWIIWHGEKDVWTPGDYVDGSTPTGK